ncbi:VanZ family protein [Candidatus Saccharibacteria bacterium]|nr:VanZ family protein [Candidatus Saccharibacteria bacterium]
MQRISRKKHAIIWWLVSIVWLSLTVYLSSQIGSESANLSRTIAEFSWNLLSKFLSKLGFARYHFYVRKLAHFFVHAVLAFTVYRASNYSFKRKGAVVAFTLILVTSVAVFDEIIQLQAPGRVSTSMDAGINLLGVCIGTCLSSILP